MIRSKSSGSPTSSNSRLQVAERGSEHVHDVFADELYVRRVRLGCLPWLVERCRDFVGGDQLQELGKDLTLVLEAWISGGS